MNQLEQLWADNDLVGIDNYVRSGRQIVVRTGWFDLFSGWPFRILLGRAQYDNTTDEYIVTGTFKMDDGGMTYRSHDFCVQRLSPENFWIVLNHMIEQKKRSEELK
jgi:hypothetical protein